MMEYGTGDGEGFGDLLGDVVEVECGNAVLRDRIRAVVERAVETVGPVWRRG